MLFFPFASFSDVFLEVPRVDIYSLNEMVNF